MPELTKPDPEILSRILLLQSVLHVAPDLAHMGDMYCSSLQIVPGVAGAALFSEGGMLAASPVIEVKESKKPVSESDWVECFPNRACERFQLSSGSSEYGFINVIISDRSGFSIYRPYIQNTANLIALMIENRYQESKLQEQTAALLQANELLASKNEELGSFAYSVSHDLRAPLRSIDGFSRAVLEDCADKLDDSGKDCLNRVLAATKKMEHLIDDMLHLSRVSRSEMIHQEVDLSGLARAITDELQEKQPERQVTFVIAPELKVDGDVNLLRIAIENLLGNAWKYTGKHSQAKIEFGVSDHKGKKAYFVRDDGAGFDNKYVEKLFGPFQRLHKSKEFEGNGIGLATVQRIIHRHGGRVWAEGAVEKGATFFFTLPKHQEMTMAGKNHR